MARPGRKKKVDDARLLGLNSVGLSLNDQANRMGVHHTSVAKRLSELGVYPMDTRRSFMADLFDDLSESQQEWLISRLVGQPVKGFIKSLLVQEFLKDQARSRASETQA